MAQQAFQQAKQTTIWDSTLYNPRFRKSIESGIIAAHKFVFTADRPPYKSYPASPYWHHAVHQVHNELRSMGFAVEEEAENQLRLFCPSSYECPVRLRFAMGKVKDGVALLNACKGKTTKQGVRQNSQHFRQQSLFAPEFALHRSITERELNLWAIYQVEPKFVTVWLVAFVEWLNPRCLRPRRFRFEYGEPICAMPLTAKNIIETPVILSRIDDGGYDIQLEDNPTGT